MRWNYESSVSQSNGYEDVVDILKTFTKQTYSTLSDAEKQNYINEVFNIYRDKNIFPITYYNQDGINSEIAKCINKEVLWNGEVLDFKFNQGQSLCRYIMPNLSRVDSGKSKNNTMYERFYNDHKLKKSIEFCFKFKENVTPSNVRTALEMIGGGVATNFKAMNAKALYEKYVPKNGIIYDFSCGFGGRMLGALSSKNDYKYFGCEPCSETYHNLNTLGTHISEFTKRNNIFKIYKCGSEDIKVKSNTADFAFSSPPYFTLEKYSDEITQCYNKFPNIDEWFDGYVKPTIENIYNILKDDAYYAVNISDFNIGKDRIEYVDRWIKLSEEVGFSFVEQIHMKLQTRRGSGHQENGIDKVKKEGIFVFKKIK